MNKKELVEKKKKRIAKKQKEKAAEKSFHKELIAQMLTLATSGFGLASALAWNTTIQSLIKTYIEPHIPGKGVTSQIINALLVTTLAVFIVYQLSKISARFQQKKS